ncbi:MAG: glutamine-hydrolyzing carbamoyl-phosphate synthase small subunit [Candidatus Saccharibacteria bacterium]|nr:glutamine-hydrolyzing carbamoyl-phosphate synthase small subunit [Candidatus Saccharibacteria bacterium]
MQGNRSSGSDFFKNKNSKLILSDGVEFEGLVPDYQANGQIGEVVFSTGMTGYTESLSDPSYSGQILVFTFPMIGNYGVDESTMESDKIYASGVIVDTLENDWSHDKSTKSLLQWLKEQNVPILYNVDTRALTKHLRTRGTMVGSIGKSKENLKNIKSSTKFADLSAIKEYPKAGGKKVILVDCGSKENIVRSLRELPISLKQVPRDYDFTNEEYDGVFVSNGPGDPEDYKETIANLKKSLQIGKPVYGICLGSQLLALAAGAKTYKMQFGNRGHNQPCLDLETNKAYITSQNHGFAVNDKTLGKDWKVIFRNLNDNSVEGIAHKTKPFYAVQFHPEACPGPTDTSFIFERFYKTL